ncbi:PadR family transcriptional regulator [Catenulispora pinisilvae]|uniref:PadR family transcriptional regulator n=1 Tax=Catenulispora pinisilvae TaxID=2705253 RepID=UPI0018926278|nr:PadR family transcriptional regulator [Catenulispora pinisilvae]
MLELCILGFLFAEPLHAYDLKARISGLSGHVRPVSDGALHPAIKRLQAAGYLSRRAEPGERGAPRQVLSLTDAGRAELLSRLRAPADVEITDRHSFFILLAFLSSLPDPADQARVLRRRLAFMDAPGSFFYDDGRPLRVRDMTDRFRRGMLQLAAASSKADRAWLEKTIAELDAESADGQDHAERADRQDLPEGADRKDHAESADGQGLAESAGRQAPESV